MFDAVSDPAMGLLSDRTRTRWGRRRPWILLASLPLAAAVALAFAPPADLAGPAATTWFGLSFFFLFVCWTAVTVPYESLGVEVTHDHHARTRLLGLRDGLLVLGTLVAAASPDLLAWALDLGDDPAGQRARFRAVGLLYAPLAVLLCATCAAVVPERDREHAAGWGGLGPLRRNRSFLVLLLAYGIGAVGTNLPAALMSYYLDYVLDSTRMGLFLSLYILTGVLVLPAWVALSRRVGKKRAWIAAMAINGGAFAPVLFLEPGDELGYGVIVVASGLGFGATLAIPSSMQADVADLDELLSGRRREGQLIGLWAIARKVSAALAVGLALPILDLAGYRPNQTQDPAVVRTLLVLYALVPTLCNGVAIAIATRYPLDEATHRRVQRELERPAAERRDAAALGL